MSVISRNPDLALAGLFRRREYHHSGFSDWRVGGVLTAFNGSVKSLFSTEPAIVETLFLNYSNFNP